MEMEREMERERKMMVMVWHTLYMLWRGSSYDVVSTPNMPHHHRHRHADHRGEEAVHLFATGAWTHDASYAMLCYAMLCDDSCVLCHADDSKLDWY
jgi:hypothetical protein